MNEEDQTSEWDAFAGQNPADLPDHVREKLDADPEARKLLDDQFAIRQLMSLKNHEQPSDLQLQQMRERLTQQLPKPSTRQPGWMPWMMPLVTAAVVMFSVFLYRQENQAPMIQEMDVKQERPGGSLMEESETRMEGKDQDRRLEKGVPNADAVKGISAGESPDESVGGSGGGGRPVASPPPMQEAPDARPAPKLPPAATPRPIPRPAPPAMIAPSEQPGAEKPEGTPSESIETKNGESDAKPADPGEEGETQEDPELIPDPSAETNRPPDQVTVPQVLPKPKPSPPKPSPPKP